MQFWDSPSPMQMFIIKKWESNQRLVVNLISAQKNLEWKSKPGALWLASLALRTHPRSKHAGRYLHCSHEDRPQWFLVIHITSLNLTSLYDVGALTRVRVGSLFLTFFSSSLGTSVQGEAYNSLCTLSMVGPDSPCPLKGPSNFTPHELLSQDRPDLVKS